MNILVIGNGFDLAHGLPTKYLDFLEFVKVIKQILKKCNVDDIDWKNINIQIKKLINSNLENVRNNLHSQEKMWNDLIGNNFWIDYFKQCNMHGKENWIDFESEISEVIQSLDDDMHGLGQIYNIEDTVCDLSNSFLKDMYSDYIDAVQPINPADNGFSEGILFKEIRDKLLDDLNRLIRAFEIYLTEYVEKIEIRKKSADISELNIDYVLSFNYTHTFSKLYKVSNNLKKENAHSLDYIHGETSSSNTIETNNMVLGIDEYLLDNRRNIDIEFIAFKKYYQRIHKQTGCKYKEWVDEIRESWEGWTESIRKEASKYISGRIIEGKEASINNIKEITHNLYIFGHSLDDTDKDILKDLILNDNVKTTIFYHNKNTMGKQIANLVKVIGQDELIKRTGGNTKTIEFKLQQDMVLIND